MTKQSRIDKGLFWDRAWSLVEGCSPASPGCDHCWAAAQAHMRQHHPNESIRKANSGLTEENGAFNGRIRFRHDLLPAPFRIKKPATWAIWTDLFCEWPGGYANRLYAFMVMSQCPQHTFLILTKRDRRMLTEMKDFQHRHEMGRLPFQWPLPNVWVIVTAENQDQADARIPHLLEAPVAHRGVIVEPMLGPMSLDGAYLYGDPALEWIIVGPETGPHARFCDPAWIHCLDRICQAADVPFFDKSPTPLAREIPWEAKS